MLMRYFSAKLFVFSFILLGSIPAPGFSQHVKSIEPQGSIILENGKSICLAGLKLSEESHPFLAALLSKKDVDFEGETEGNPCGYLYVNTSELPLPFKLGEQPEAKRYMVNEVLLKTGAAKVDGDTKAIFKLKEKFLALEAEAKQTGQGIWSYEEHPLKGKGRFSR